MVKTLWILLPGHRIPVAVLCPVEVWFRLAMLPHGLAAVPHSPSIFISHLLCLTSAILCLTPNALSHGSYLCFLSYAASAPIFYLSFRIDPIQSILHSLLEKLLLFYSLPLIVSSSRIHFLPLYIFHSTFVCPGIRPQNVVRQLIDSPHIFSKSRRL